MAENESEKNTEKTSALKALGNKALKSDSLVFTFLRSIVSSQCAGWIDMFIGFALFAWASFTPAFATAIGAVCGGIVNCIINYKFTFRADGVDWRAVVVKYLLIWAGSAMLNSFGTEALYNLISGWQWLETIGFRPDGYYATARLTVALLISWFWNFPMQRYFVYRTVSFDSFAIALFSFFRSNKDKKQTK